MPRTSTKQEEILQFITRYLERNSFAPSIREICDAVGLKSTATVYYHLSALKKSGQLNMAPAKKRSITLPATQQGRIPIVGVVTAGRPILAVENIEGYLVTEETGGDRFALRVRGDSMIGAGILSGDLVIVRPQQDAVNGQIVVAMLEDEATVKRFHRGADGVWLLPENDAYEPIDGRNARIIGRVVGLVRQY